MRKKNRTLRQLGDSQAICDYHNKRSGALCKSLSTKKLRISENAQSELQFQTPYPTALSESQIFKLPSSKALPLSPDHQFSPLPLAPKNVSSSGTASKRRAYTRSSNAFLKENAIDRCSVPLISGPRSHFRLNNAGNISGMQDGVGSKISAIHISGVNAVNPSDAYIEGTSSELASPFSSRPSSPRPSPEETEAIAGPALQAVRSTLRKANDFDGSSPLATSEFIFSRSVQTQAQSTTTSPVRSSELFTLNGEPLSSTSLRRPSAPTASRPRVDSWARFLPRVSDPESHEDRRDALEKLSRCTDPQSLASENLQQVHLEPSLRSATLQDREKWIWTDAAVDFDRPPSQLSFNIDFFNDVQGASTPLRDIKSNLETRLATQDLDTDREISSHSPPLSPFDRLADELDGFSILTSGMNSWITDSLISPPSEYRRRRCDPDWHMDQEDADEDGDSDSDDFSGCLRNLVDNTTNGTSSAVEAQTCEDISLAICTENLPVKAAEVAAEAPSTCEVETAKNITAKAASNPVCTKPQQTGRMRRGTIRASDHALQPPKVGQARRSRSGTIVGPSAARRTRSGTIIGPVSQKTAPGAAKNRQTSVMPGNEKIKSSSATGSAGDPVIVEDRDDEINAFNEEWVDEPWVVADPPSPVAAKTRSRNARALRPAKCPPLNKKVVLKHRIGENAAENCEDSSDDELLLK
ncbi:hypothetical protein F5887DRAFT_1087926 [Amanita rubescens]|nr:hypothetical protein F5887DRAFT_1087926 [Amanita rubescens]